MSDRKERAVKFTKEQLILFVRYWKYYGFKYAYHSLIWWICFYFRSRWSYSVSKKAVIYKTKFWDERIKKKYTNIVKESITAADSTKRSSELSNSNTIWVFWAQGEDQMPPLVKSCFAQMKKNNNDVRLVTWDNLSKYIALDEQIIAKANKGTIKWANISDIIRNTLLAQYGGMWLDATIWTSNAVPFDKLSTTPFWTAFFSKPLTNSKIFFWSSFQWNWSSSILYARKPHFILYEFASKMLIQIALHEPIWPDYVIQDYLYYYSCRFFPDVTQNINRSIISAERRIDLAAMMNEEYTDQKYAELTKDDYFFKLSFRKGWKKTP